MNESMKGYINQSYFQNQSYKVRTSVWLSSLLPLLLRSLNGLQMSSKPPLSCRMRPLRAAKLRVDTPSITKVIFA